MSEDNYEEMSYDEVEDQDNYEPEDDEG